MKASAARVVFSGATGGIGSAGTLALAQAGAALLLVGRDPVRLASQAQQLAQAAGGKGANIATHAADLAQVESIPAFARAAADWGANVVVHGAGLPAFGALETLSQTDIAQVLQVNLLAPILLTRALLPHLRRQAAAQVLCVGSALGAIGLPGFAVYGASKFGLRGFAQALRRELADTSVLVQYLGPRSTATEFQSAASVAYNRATGANTDAPAVVARELLALLESGAAERFVGFPEKLAVRVNGLASELLDGSFARHRQSLAASASPAAAS